MTGWVVKDHFRWLQESLSEEGALEARSGFQKTL